VDRRNFLLGALTATASGLLVKADTPGVEAFAPVPGEPVTIMRPYEFDPELGRYVYDQHGQRLGIIADVHHEFNELDMTHHISSEEHYTLGSRYRTTLRVVVLPKGFSA